MRVKKQTLSYLILGIIITISSLLIGCNKNVLEEEKQVYAWPIATASPEDTVTQIFAEKFAEEVEKMSDGKMIIQVYSNSVLGGDRELLESCKDGDIPFVVQNTAPQVSFIKEVSIFDLPCVFTDIEDVRQTIDNEEFLSVMKDAYKKSGYKLMGYSDQGFRVMSTNKMVKEFNDYKGQKIRIMENPYHLQFWRSINASPTPMSFSEVYIGLQQKTIDAQENPYEVIVSNRLYEQQKYIIETNHLPHLISFIVSEKFYEKLSPEDQDIINKAAQVAIDYSRKVSDERVEEKMDIIKSTGTEIIPISENLRDEMIEASQSVYNNIRDVVGNDLINLYTNHK